MKRTTYSIIFLLLYLFSNGQENKNSFQTLIDTIYANNPNAVGILLHVEAPDYNVSESFAVGFSERATQKPLDANEPVLIASSIKPYVSATILRLQEEGKLNIENNIKKFLSKKTIQLFEQDGYLLDSIKIKHLLSHTSGIYNYANSDYLDWIDKNQQHRWTRDEQLQLSIDKGSPLGNAGTVFNYADANYLLSTEIMEQIEHKPFYEVMREKLRWKQLQLNSTWFPILEEMPKKAKPMAHQYWDTKNWDSYKHDISWDLYGGGGIASTTKDLANFAHSLFNNQIITTDSIQKLLYTNPKTKETASYPYYLGISQKEYKGYSSLGHGGFWGTVVRYFPTFNATIAISIQNRDYRKLRKNVFDGVIQLFDELANEQKINNEIKAYIDGVKDFNGAILIAHNDSIISKNVKGYANLQYKIPNTPQTRFNIASITKLMTAIGVLRLQDQGKIDISKPVGYYLKDYPNNQVRDSVFIHQLLSHTSGVPRIYSDKLLNSTKNKYKTIRDFLPLIVNDSLNFKPGTAYEYSGGGFLLLGLIIEEVTGKNYYDYMQENIFSLAGMNSTSEIDLENLNDNIASGYTSFLTEDGSLKKNEYYLTKTSPAGFYYSTIDDLFLFSKAMRNGVLINNETWQELITPQTWGYTTQLGLGIDIDQRYNQKIVGHSGGWYGVRAELLDFLATNHTLIVLSNIDDNGVSGASKVIDHLKAIIAGNRR